jgi:flagellar basal body-associated protein FliL
MPVEKFSADAEAAKDETDETAADEAVRNTRAGRGVLQRLKVPAGVGAALAALILACFLLIGDRDRPKMGVSGGDATLVQLEPQIVNLAEPGQSLDVRIVFEASSPEFAALLRRRTAQLADISIGVIGTMTVNDLDTELERNRLKRALADAIGQRLRSDDAYITNVYFTRFYYRSD